MSGTEEQHGEELLDRLVVDCLEAYEARGESGVEALLAREPQHAPELRRRLDALRAAGMLGLARPAAAGAPAELGDFLLLSTLGEGAMGVVYLAEQRSLGRRVALKLIRPEHLFFPGARERFRREADAAARLAHPGIAVVHAVGEEGGLPYFAMELVEGLSFSDVIASFHGRAPAELRGADLVELLARRFPGHAVDAKAPIFAGSWIDTSLRAAREVARALEHAHERGVLHRDVKPSNVMVSPDGRVRLVDFGLAALRGADRTTRTGSQVGSLAYMAPEQVEGRTDAIDARTDVWGVGVLLYELLALRLPFEHPSVEGLARQIVAGRPPPLRARNRAVSEDVDVVCRTALEPDLDRRYATAERFAHDVSNVLERRPIDARPAGIALRLRRWAQRHPGWAATAALSIALVVGGPLAIAWRQSRERAAIAVEAERAEANYRDAVDALRVLQRVAAEDLASVPGATRSRETILEAALRFHLQLAARRTDDPRARREVAIAQSEAGDLQGLLGRESDALASLGPAEASLDALSRTDPDAATLRALAQVRARLAEVARRAGELARAESAARASAVGFEALAAGTDALPDDEVEAAGSRRKLAAALRAQNRLDETQTELQAARTALERIVAAHPASSAARWQLAITCTSLGDLASLREIHADAVEPLQRAAGLCEELVAESKGDARYREQLAVVHDVLAPVVFRMRRADDFEASASRSIELGEELVREFPDLPRHRERLGSALTNRGALRLGIGRAADGEADLARAAQMFADLAASSPDVPGYVLRRSTTEMNLASVMTATKRPVEGEALARAARERLEAVLPKLGGDPEAMSALTFLALVTAQSAQLQGRYADCVAAVEKLETARTPEERLHAAGLAATCMSYADEDAALTPEERTAARTHYADVAFAHLATAVELGLADARAIEKNPAFKSLRDDARFPGLLDSVRQRAAR